jgi:hypothetical protein
VTSADFRASVPMTIVRVAGKSVNPTSWSLMRNTSLIKVYHIPGMTVQLQAYFNCAKMSSLDNITWIFFTDIDEFLVLKKHKFVTDFLEQHCLEGSLSLNWRIFGTSGKKVYEPKPVLKRFQYRLEDDDDANRFVKTFVRVKDMKLRRRFFIHPHYFILQRKKKQRDTNGVAFTGSIHIGPGDVALIYHYRFKSYEEYYKIKLSRGDVSLEGHRMDVFESLTVPMNRMTISQTAVNLMTQHGKFFYTMFLGTRCMSHLTNLSSMVMIRHNIHTEADWFGLKSIPQY